LRRTREQAREEIARRFRAHQQASARFRRQLFACSFAFVICAGIVLAFGMLPTDREVPPSADTSDLQQSTQTVSGEQSREDEWAGSVEESETDSVPSDWSDESEDFAGPEWGDGPAEAPDEDSSECSDETLTNVSKPQDESSAEESYAENDLMAGIEKYPYIEEERDPELMEARIDFALELFRASLDQRGESGVLVSPLSAEFVLAMLGGCASGETLAEMEQVMIDGESMDRLNRYHHTYLQEVDFLVDRFGMPEPKIASSLWFDRTGTVSTSYLQKMLSYYRAEAFETDLDGDGLQEINDWVSAKTDGRNVRLYDSLSPDVTAVLVNSIQFRIIWDQKPTVSDGVFYNANGGTTAVKMLCLPTDFGIDNDQVTGILRRYDRYDFFALMPKEGVDIYEYAASLDKETYLTTMWSASERVTGCIPQFSFRDTVDLASLLPQTGLGAVTDQARASFDGMMDKPFYLTDLMQQSFVELTSDAAEKDDAEFETPNPPSGTVVLDRPFVYFLVDYDGMPIYMGVLTEID